METIKMTEEYRQKMKGLLPLSADGEHSFIPKSVLSRGLTDEEKEYAPRFFVKQWTNKQILAVRKFMDERTTATRENNGVAPVIDIRGTYVPLIGDALTGWENVYDYSKDDFVAIEFTAENIKKLPEPIIEDIMDEITDLSGIVVRTEMALKKFAELKKQAEQEVEKEDAEA